LNKNAVLSIFETKGRPLTDPVIVHISCIEDALPLIDLPLSSDMELFRALADAFWPGPLTLVVKASRLVPSEVTAATGFVGIRWPRHPIAQALIKAAGVPIAAPSANRFGHVSPTTAQHVVDDLGQSSIVVLDTEDDALPADSVGFESTVLNIALKPPKVLRQGGVSVDDLRVFFQYHNGSEVSLANMEASTDAAGLVSPGVMLTHYAPDCPAFLLSSSSSPDDELSGKAEQTVCALERAVLVDFNGAFVHLSQHVLAYRDLSASGLPQEAGRCLFSVLRWSETVPEAQAILLPMLSREATTLDGAVADRLFRAASGQVVQLSMSPLGQQIVHSQR
jgi:L-threonylcarbamoyladenylate synthase